MEQGRSLKIVVVGSRGFLGRHLVSHLKARRLDVVELSSSSAAGIDAVSGLLPSSFTLPAATDAVVYLSQSPWYRKVPEMAGHVLNVNVVSAARIAELCRRAGVRRLVYTSTGNVYAPAFSPLSEASPLRRD